MTRPTLLLAFLLILPARIASAAAAAPADLDKAFAQLPGYKLGGDRAAVDAIAAEVIKTQSDPIARAAIAARLAAVLSTDATIDARSFACRQLYIAATPAEVPAVARLLTDEKLSHMGRYVLEAMADPAADAALRAAIPNVKGKLLVGIINSLGDRRDAQSLAAIKPLTGDSDPLVAAAAATALGKIGTADAAAALAPLRNAPNAEVKNAAIDACLLCADQLAKTDKAKAVAIYQDLRGGDQPAPVRIAALRGLVIVQPEKAMPILLDLLKGEDVPAQSFAASMLRHLPGAELSAALGAALPTLPVANQPLLIDALAARGDAEARSPVLAAMKSSAEPVRIAAIKAIGQLGDARDLPALLQMLASGTPGEKDAARASIGRLKGDVDGTLVKTIESAAPDARADLIKILPARRATSAVPALLSVAASDPAEPVRLAAIEALAALVSEKQFAGMVDLIVNARSEAERTAAADALMTASQRAKNREECAGPIVSALPMATPETKVALVNVLARFGGQPALLAVRGAAKDSNPAVREAAIRALTSWPTMDAVPDMLGLAQSGDQTQKVLAVRGLVALIRTKGRPAREALDLARKTLATCERPEEKRLVIAAAADMRDPGAIDVIMPCLADPTLKAETTMAILKIARAAGVATARAQLEKAMEFVDAPAKVQIKALIQKGW